MIEADNYGMSSFATNLTSNLGRLEVDSLGDISERKKTRIRRLLEVRFIDTKESYECGKCESSTLVVCVVTNEPYDWSRPFRMIIMSSLSST